jgi:hypothetical protein
MLICPNRQDPFLHSIMTRRLSATDGFSEYFIDKEREEHTSISQRGLVLPRSPAGSVQIWGKGVVEVKGHTFREESVAALTTQRT